MNPSTRQFLLYFNDPVPFSLEFFFIFTDFQRKSYVLKVEREVMLSWIIMKSQLNVLILHEGLWCCTLYS